MTPMASKIADFMDIRGNHYDGRRYAPEWAPLFRRWTDTYERLKSDGKSDFCQCIHAANAEAIDTLLSELPK